MSDQPPPGLDPVIAEFYRRTPEEHRLEQGPFLLEEMRTRDLIERHAPRPPATVLDVGGAAGAYALWLADGGYAVHLVDPVPRLVAEAERRSAAHPRPLACAEVVDAGLIVDGLYGIEGPGWLLPDVGARLADPRRRADLLHVARLLESEPAMLGVSAHLLVVARTAADH